jgi:Arc/MetJ family transcription regulator
MRKTTIVVDDDLVAQAQTVLGTSGLKDTVDAALKEVVASAARRAHARRLREMRGLDLDRPEIMEQAWR